MNFRRSKATWLKAAPTDMIPLKLLISRRCWITLSHLIAIFTLNFMVFFLRMHSVTQ